MFLSKAVLRVVICCADVCSRGCRTVKVIKLISKDSIEDCILQLGQKKLKLEQDMTTAEQSKNMCTHVYAFLIACTLAL